MSGHGKNGELPRIRPKQDRHVDTVPRHEHGLDNDQSRLATKSSCAETSHKSQLQLRPEGRKFSNIRKLRKASGHFDPTQRDTRSTQPGSQYYHNHHHKHPNDYERNQQQHHQCLSSRKLILGQLSSLVAFVVLITYTAGYIPASDAVDCFKCSSRNGSNPDCEDPFHNTNTTRVNYPVLPEPQPAVIYHTPCYAGKKGREGLFPASACIKLTGIFDKTGETLVVRHCALDSGSLTQDTELARMSHCGKFQFEGDLLRGCVLACPEDACNSAVSTLRLGLANQLAPFIVWLPLITSLCLGCASVTQAATRLRPAQR